MPDAEAAGAVLIVKTKASNNNYFAFSFGTIGHYLLRFGTWRRGYGLRTALNVLYPRLAAGTQRSPSLLALQAKRHGGQTVRSRQQATREVAFETFEIDRLREILDTATGRPVDTASWGKKVSGADSIHLDIEVDFNDLGSLCEEIEAAYNRPDYQDDFGWLDYIQPVTDPILHQSLEQQIVDQLKTGKIDTIQLAPPEIIDWDRVVGFRFFFDRQRPPITRPELRLEDLLTRLGHDGHLSTVDSSYLRSHSITAVDAAGLPVHHWPVWRCLTADFEYSRQSYVFDDGEFFAIDATYLTDLNRFLSQIPSLNLSLPHATSSMQEEAVNKLIVASHPDRTLLLDRQLVTISSRTTAIEICDVLTSNGVMIHVKRHLGSSDLSHLFAQGYVSAELLQANQEFRVAARNKIADQPGGASFLIFEDASLDPSKFEISYVIVANLKKKGLVDRLPFFSKINLRRTVEQLTGRGFRVSWTAIDTAS